MMGSNMGPKFVAQCTLERRITFVDPHVTREQLDDMLQELYDASTAASMQDGDLQTACDALGFGPCRPYGMTKACVASYAMTVARRRPDLIVNTCHPGAIETDLTRAFAAKMHTTCEKMGLRPVGEGVACPMFLLTGNVPTPKGEAYFYGPDCQRSPLHRDRQAGDPPYDGYIDDVLSPEDKSR
eukprot:m.210327 g.210327  ORF g.210327 m.210327 type:complete len:184 (+) comp24957_c0_seq1:341-892(+)